jgi:hypothetical protein
VTTDRERGDRAGEGEADGLDPVLVELFQAAEAPPGHAREEAFCLEVARRVRRLRRWRRLRGLAASGAGALLLYAGITDLARLGRAASLAAAAGVLQLGAWLISPAGWVCSVALGVAVVWRSRTLRR